MSVLTADSTAKQDFEFAQFNQALAGRSSRAGGTLLVVMDCSFVGKSGKATFGLDRF